MQLVGKADVSTCPLRGKEAVCETCWIPRVVGMTEMTDRIMTRESHHGSCVQRTPLEEDVEAEKGAH